MKKSTLPVIILSFGVLTTLPAAAKVIYEPYTITTLAGWGSNEHTVDGPRHLAEFASPGGVAVDKEGNVFVAEFWGCTIRKITPKGVASTFAGKAGEPGHVDGQGGDARFDWPRGVALADDGTLYVTEEYGNTIRKVDRQGLVTTLAFGFGGAFGLVVAPSGDVFVADAGDFSVKKITPQGDVTTFAGGTFGFKDGTGTEAEFDSPVDITVDQLGNLYVADSFNNAIRKITPDAVVTTLATGITFPNGLTLDKDGYIFVSEGYFIDKVSPTGEVTEFAGGTWGSEDGVGLKAQFSLPQRIAIDRTGNFYVSDAEGVELVWANETIRKITPDAVVTTFCGVSTMGSHDGVGPKARFFWPRGVAATPGGTLYVADTNNSTLRKIAPNGLVTTIAGKVQTPGYVDGSASDARFNDPCGLALDKWGNLFVADQGNNVIRKMTSDGQVSTIANGYNFSAPYGVAIDRHGNIYVSASFNQTIDKVTPEGAVTILAGSPGQSGYQDGTGEDARFNVPAGLALDASGNIFVADLYNNSIRKITTVGVVTTLAGSLRAGSNDGIGSDARFRNPAGVAVDRAGNVYVGDYANSTLRKVTPEGSVTTLAGSPQAPDWVDGTGGAARLNSAEGIAVDDSGNVYFADVGNESIRKAVPTSQ